jgi:lysophospholipase L1-like esterase
MLLPASWLTEFIMGQRRLAALSLLLTTLLTGFLVSPASPAQAATVDYVALGDSYSSGVGAPGLSGLCLQSQQSYAPRWAEAHQASFFFAACAGAVTDNVRDFQIWALNSRTDAVTITIGGNDVGFASTMITCTFGSTPSCLDSIDQGREYAQSTLIGDLDATYAAIHRRAAKAQVYVLGYPRLFEETSCPGGLSLTKRRALNQAADELSDLIAGRVSAAGFTYVDVRGAFAGHGICGSTPWINDFSVSVNAFHPNAAGYRNGYLPALTAVTG